MKLKTGIELIAEERKRQIEVEGRTIQDDVEFHSQGSIALAAAAYAVAEDARNNYKDDTIPSFWPWNEKWWKPTPRNRVRELQKAGALIAAEIDRLLYLTPDKGSEKE